MKFLNNKNPIKTLIVGLIGLILLFNLFSGTSTLITNFVLFYIYGIIIYWYIKDSVLAPIINSISLFLVLSIGSFSSLQLEELYTNITGVLIPLYIFIYTGSMAIYEINKKNINFKFAKFPGFDAIISAIFTLLFIFINTMVYSYMNISNIYITVIIAILIIVIEELIFLFFINKEKE